MIRKANFNFISFFKFIILLIGLVYFDVVSAQFGDSTKISFSGIIYDSQALKTPLSQVNIFKTNLLGTSSSLDGNFFIDVKANDTLTFSHVGFHSITITIPDSLTSGSLVAKLFLVSDTISLEQVYISSLKDFDNFKSQFLNMEVQPNKELLNAQNNINLSVYEARTTTESTTEDKLEASLQKEAEKSIYFGQIPADNIIDFVSIASGLIDIISTKNEKDDFYKDFVNLRNQNNIIYIKP